MPGQPSRLDPANMPKDPRADGEDISVRSFQRLDSFHFKLLVHFVFARIHLLIEANKEMCSILDQIGRCR